MTITIYNNTNTVINSCISAGVNYSWVNGLKPGEFYVHEASGAHMTLKTNYWAGEASEFSNSAAEIGCFVSSTVLGLISLIAIPATAGGSLVAYGALMTAIGAAGAAGTVIGGISIGIHDWQNTPSQKSGIWSGSNPIYMAKGRLETENNSIVSASQIELIEITQDQLKALQAHRMTDGYDLVKIFQEESINEHMKYMFHSRSADLANAHQFNRQEPAHFMAFDKPVFDGEGRELTVPVYAEHYKDDSRPYFHFSTRSVSEAAKYGYIRSEIMFHAYNSKQEGTIPLYLEYNRSNDAIYYLSTRSEEEARKNNFLRSGVMVGGVWNNLCWVFPVKN